MKKLFLAIFCFSTSVAFAQTAQDDISNSQPVKLAGGDEGNFADVYLSGGKYRLGVDIGSGPFSVSQSGTWSTGRTWTLSSGTDSVNVGNFPSTFGVTQGTSPWLTSRNWNLNYATDSATVRLNDGSGNSLSSNAGALYVVGRDSAGIFNSSRVLTVQGAGIGSAPIQAGVVASIPAQVMPTTSSPSYSNGIPNHLSATLSGALRVDGSAVTQPISAASLPLPTGAATEATLSAFSAKFSVLGQNTMANSQPVVIASDQSAIPVSGTFWQATQPVSVSSLPLPTGASTSALQTTGNSSLSSIDTKIPSNLTVTSTRLLVDGSGVTQPISAASLPLPTGAATSANQSTTNSLLTTIDGGIPAALGQTTMSASMPVTIASNQTAIPISGTVTAAPGDGSGTTYSAAASGFVPASSATDIFCIKGSATKTVRIITIAVTGTTTAGSGFSVSMKLAKRSTANTGASVAANIVPHDSTSAAGTASVFHYTANPTLGTLVGAIRAHRMSVNTAGVAGGSAQFNEYHFGDRPAQAIYLRGTSESLCVNLNATTITGPIFSANVEWVEF